MTNYIAYNRVSTQKQGQSGLGLEAQKVIVENYVQSRSQLLAEYIEIESGRKNSRPKLAEALRTCKEQKAKLIIAKLDRLSRNAAFVMALQDSKVEFVACDLPDANTLTIGLMATIAQHEAEVISGRTRVALAAKKARGFKLGKPENLTNEARSRGVAVIHQNARNHPANQQAAELIRLYQRDNLTTRAIAQRLNEHGFRTRKGKLFKSETVCRFINRQ